MQSSVIFLRWILLKFSTSIHEANLNRPLWLRTHWLPPPANSDNTAVKASVAGTIG